MAIHQPGTLVQRMGTFRDLSSGQLPIGTCRANFPSWEGCPKGGVGQIYDHRYPIDYG